MNQGPANADSPWPHRLAVVLVCAVFPLIWVGGLVTTYGAGMAVPDWPSTYGYNLFLYPWQTWIYGPWALFIEHGHRLLGAMSGLLTIALVVAVWRCDRRGWVRALSVVALLAVIGQGVLGGLRVLMDERLLAKIHACTGPAFFALCVALAVVTSHRWKHGPARRPLREAGSLQSLAAVTTLLAYFQLVLGAQLRHLSVDGDTRRFQAFVFFHLFLAAVLTLHIALLSTRAWRLRRDEPWLKWPGVALAVLIVVQLCLGAGTWVTNYGFPAFVAEEAWTAGYTVVAHSPLQTRVTTAHVAVGSLILVVALMLTLRSGRALAPQRRAESPRRGPISTVLWMRAAEVSR